MTASERIDMQKRLAALEATGDKGLETTIEIRHIEQKLKEDDAEKLAIATSMPVGASTASNQNVSNVHLISIDNKLENPSPIYNYNVTSTLNATSTPLNAGATFTGSAELNNLSCVFITCITDQNGTMSAEFSKNGTDWDSTLSIDVSANVNEIHRLVKAGRYFRIVFTNSSGSNQTFLRLNVYYGDFPQINSALNQSIQQDADSIVVRAVESQIDIAASRYTGYSIVNKAGFNPDIDTSGLPEDIWDNGGTYTGFPNTNGETITVVSTSVNDTSAGTGLKTLRITGLDANYNVQTEDFTMNGTTPVTGLKTFTRVHTAQGLTSDGANNTNFNAGTISIYHTTTTANVFLVMRIGTNQTNSSGYTIPAGYTGYVRRIFASVGVTAGSTSGIDYAIWTQPALKTSAPRLRRPNSAYYGAITNDEIYGGLIFTEKTDLILRVAASAANNTPVSGGYDLILIKNSTQVLS